MDANRRERVVDWQGHNRGWKTWIICPHCEKGRWVRDDAIRNPHFTGLCNKCHAKYTTGKMSEHSHWKGGRTIKNGYVYVRLSPDDFFYPMARHDGYVREHRLVVAKHLGRCLTSQEVVHHKGVKFPQGSIENKQDNRYPENLELITGGVFHLLDSNPKSQITRLKKYIKELEAKLNKRKRKEKVNGSNDQS